MSAPAAREGSVPKRVLLALREVAPAATLLSAASTLLQGAQAELAGLFVEDVQLLRGAALPFTREIGLTSGTVRSLDLPEVERALKTQAEQVRQLLAQTAAALQAPWSFRVIRGSLLDEALVGAAHADLVLIGQQPPALRRSIGQPPPQAEQIVSALFDATEAGFRVLAVALQLAQGHAELISLLLPRANSAGAERLRQLAAEHLHVAPHVPAMETMPGTFRHKRRRALVLATGSVLGSRRDIELLVATADCPVVLVR